MALIIVESPTKARTFNHILKGGDYFVFATMGHIRDLPPNKIGINYKHDFQPDYGIIKNKQKVVNQLKELAKKNKEIILATDPDREGESISYHAAYILGLIKEDWPDFKFIKGQEPKRIVFHEITTRALKEALENPQSLRLNLVKAQQARRILDRIVGYELSPLLWKKMGKNWLSAGRVQTVALRIIVEREKEIKKFKIENYFQIYGLFNTKDDFTVKAKLVRQKGIDFEQKFTLKLFSGDYTYTKTTITANNVSSYKTDLQSDSYKILKIDEGIVKRYPPPPFTTSLLQQESFHRFGFSSRMTMKLAQDLYERGLITYHRTDSFNLASQFVFAAKDYIAEKYGKNYSLEKPRGYHTKSKMAQEAHEAIRPTKLIEILPKKDTKITTNHRKLYKLIFDRALSTQMREAEIKTIKATVLSEKTYEFEADYQVILFDGFLRVLNPEFVGKNTITPPIKVGESVSLTNLETQDNQTKPPPRFNEASLIKLMEEKGIGRPSTYAPIITLIQTKNYVEKENRYFAPTNLGVAIADYLSKSFPQLFSLDFTASMEESLDQVAQDKEDFIQLLKTFNSPFQTELSARKKDTSPINVEEEITEKCPKCKAPLTVRFSRFGRFLACTRYPDCKFTKPFLKFIAGKNCPLCGGKIVLRFTKSKKRFYGCENYPKCEWRSWKLNF